jgi:hypothetical protein
MHSEVLEKMGTRQKVIFAISENTRDDELPIVENLLFKYLVAPVQVA